MSPESESVSLPEQAPHAEGQALSAEAPSAPSANQAAEAPAPEEGEASSSASPTEAPGPEEGEAPGPEEGEASEVNRLARDTIRALDLGELNSPQQQLTEAALWLAIVNLGEHVRPELERLLAGETWRVLRPKAGAVCSPALNRIALGLVLQELAATPASGTAERVLSALAVMALGCADPEAGLRLQRGFGKLRLLELVDQIPVAAQVRTLTLEFRNLPLRRKLRAGEEPVPVAFAARVEDLLDRLDAESLLRFAIADQPGRREEALGLSEEGLVAALIGSRAPTLHALLEVLLAAEATCGSGETLLARCHEHAPTVWGPASEAELAELGRRYDELRQILTTTPFSLRPRAGGEWGLANEE